MNDVPIDLGSVPRFSRIDEYFGLAAFEPVRFTRMWEQLSLMAQSGALAAHIRERVAATVMPRVSENGKPFRWGYMKAAAGDDGNLVPLADGSKDASGRPMNAAIIQLSGVLMKQVGSMDDGTSTVSARMQIRAAAADDEIAAILLVIDSPGGYVSGTSDLAMDIARAAGQKPVMALVEDLCASAAYWCAANCDAIYANQATAEVGSIGVFMAFYEATAAAAMKGLKAKVYATGPLKGAGFPGTAITAEQDAYFQAMVDDTNTHFVKAVAAGRKMGQGAVKALATGAVYPAAQAVENGLIDGIKTFEQTLGLLAAAAMKQQKSGAGAGRRSADNSPRIGSKEVIMTTPNTAPAPGTAATLAQLKSAMPKSTAEFREGCLEDGLTLEAAMKLHSEQTHLALEDAQAKAKKVGVPAVLPTGKLPAGAASTTAKKLLNARTSELVAEGKQRNEAWAQACRENPEARRDLVVAHNLKHGRKRLAAQFAEEFPDIADAGDEE